jgi:hypothetical protein
MIRLRAYPYRERPIRGRNLIRRAKAFTCSSGINEQKSRIVTTEFTEGKSEKAEKSVFSLCPPCSL